MASEPRESTQAEHPAQHPCEWCPNEDVYETWLITIWGQDGSKRDTWLCDGCYDSLDWQGDEPPDGWLEK